MEIIIIIFGIIIDYFSKKWALGTLRLGQSIDIIKGFFDLEYLENRGAAFGIFSNNTRLLALVSLIVAIFLIIYLIKNKKSHTLNRISLSLIISGAIGNMIDRAFYGYVVDFIHFHYKNKYHFPTFNVADMLVVMGVILMIIYLIFFEKGDVYEGK